MKTWRNGVQQRLEENASADRNKERGEVGRGGVGRREGVYRCELMTFNSSLNRGDACSLCPFRLRCFAPCERCDWVLRNSQAEKGRLRFSSTVLSPIINGLFLFANCEVYMNLLSVSLFKFKILVSYF